MSVCVPQGRSGRSLAQRPSHQPSSRIHHRSCAEVRASTQARSIQAIKNIESKSHV